MATSLLQGGLHEGITETRILFAPFIHEGRFLISHSFAILIDKPMSKMPIMSSLMNSLLFHLLFKHLKWENKGLCLGCSKLGCISWPFGMANSNIVGMHII